MQPCESPKPASLEEALALVDSMAITIRLQSLKIEQLTRRLFGPTSEKLPLEDNQLSLLDQDSPSEPAVSSEVLVEKEEVDQPERKPRTPRQPVAKDLEVVEERLEGESGVRSIQLTFETVSWTSNAGRAAENRKHWGRFGESGNGAIRARE